MAQITPPNTVVLHCEIEVNGQPLWADTIVPQPAWDAADDTVRDHFRDRARQALSDAVVRHMRLVIDAAPVTANEPDAGGAA